MNDKALDRLIRRKARLAWQMEPTRQKLDPAIEARYGEHPSASDEVLRMVHAFSDDGRKRRVIKLAARVRELERALERVLKSANPNSIEHPAMFAAWALGRAALSNLASPSEPPKDQPHA